ncbi:DNA-binding transcriptional LysR family regulator [Pseudomonas nitritireducens]|uniref:DNA-binding transcriptional LysR family regulator n=1 Tax=Pseudomonas nitroreducens TaxID=46680 RepID=A0A7W7KMY1_PSENT|nr:LysR substrate-binding domain-containing protein [Pseudomonas nitritireducens]MBB4865784.1 DNA-binding transcriptional LysR family regulator [Pseudomonas nitritireducens]
MTGLRDLPPLNALRTFEAAARHGSFKQAAEELCVTQAAVSRQVQVLEAFYGLPLFLRSNRRVELTGQGQTLYQAATSALQHIASTSRDLLRSSGQDFLPLHTTSAFAQLWLLPRLRRLRLAHPDLQLHLISGEGNPDYREGFQAAVTLGLEEHPQYQAQELFSEEVFPVCTPGFLARHPQAATLDGLLGLPLLNLSASHWKARLWEPVDWAFWLKRLGLKSQPAREAMSFSHFSLLIDAVHQEEGVGLAWRHLVQHQLDAGSLVRPVPQSWKADERKHYFVCRRELGNSRQLQQLCDWLLEETEPLRANLRAD